jgi:predicted nucleotidyltransferase
MSGEEKPGPVKELPKPVDTQTALQEAIEKLALLGDGALIGGLALSYYGLERYTKDIDFAVTRESTIKAEALLQAFDLKQLRIGGVSFTTSQGVRVALIDRRVEYQDLFEEALTAATTSGPRLKRGEALIPVLPLPYLVACKLIADRPQDAVDLRFLLAHQELDYPKTRDIVYRHLGRFAAQYLDKLARAAGRTDPPKEYTPQDS